MWRCRSASRSDGASGMERKRVSDGVLIVLSTVSTSRSRMATWSRARSATAARLSIALGSNSASSARTRLRRKRASRFELSLLGVIVRSRRNASLSSTVAIGVRRSPAGPGGHAGLSGLPRCRTRHARLPAGCRSSGHGQPRTCERNIRPRPRPR